jgi:DNA-binding transcriptional ArsR family regulator
MDSLLDTLGHPVRLRVVELLLHDGELTQKSVLDRLEETREGSLSKHMKELLASGVVVRDTPRGPCRVPHRDLTLRLLQAASELDLAITAGRADEALERSRRLSDLG